MEINSSETLLRHPFTAILAGPTGCGKTCFIQELLKSTAEIISPMPERIIYCYSIWQQRFSDMLIATPSIEFKEGMLDFSSIDKNIRNLVILDDLMHESRDDVTIANVFTRESHHKNISIIFLSQNLFVQGKQMRSISLNAHYLVLFKNPRDKGQFSCLSRQMYPTKQNFLSECYDDATLRPYGYIFIDLKQETEDRLRIRTNIFPGEQSYVYVLKEKLFFFSLLIMFIQ
jgi:hypothetical protein